MQFSTRSYSYVPIYEEVGIYKALHELLSLIRIFEILSLATTVATKNGSVALRIQSNFFVSDSGEFSFIGHLLCSLLLDDPILIGEIKRFDGDFQN